MNLLIMMIFFFSVIILRVGGGKSFLPLRLAVFWFAGEVSQVHPDVLPVLKPDVDGARATFREISFFFFLAVATRCPTQLATLGSNTAISRLNL